MKMEKITIMTGPPVEGPDFYGRERDLNYVWNNYILNNISVLLAAPRRVGKSSFSKRMLKKAQEEGWKVMYLDLQGMRTEKDLVKEFKNKFESEKWVDSVKSRTGDVLVKLLDSLKDVEIAGTKVSVDMEVWRRNAYDDIKKVIDGVGDNVLIVMDELTIYLNNLLEQEKGRERVEEFLEWLRRFRQISGSKVCWIFCSSIGIENFASVHRLSKHFNDMQSHPIGAFTETEAKQFIQRLKVAENVRFTDEHVVYILDKLKWYLPFFIQILVREIDSLVDTENRPLCNDTIDDAYNCLLTKIHFNTWDERLCDYRDMENNARKILKLCTSLEGMSRSNLLLNLSSGHPDTEKIETELARLLTMLQNDGYIMENDGRYVFRSPLLRDFWHKRFIL